LREKNDRDFVSRLGCNISHALPPHNHIIRASQRLIERLQVEANRDQHDYLGVSRRHEYMRKNKKLNQRINEINARVQTMKCGKARKMSGYEIARGYDAGQHD
jgi:hypothetical protein